MALGAVADEGEGVVLEVLLQAIESVMQVIRLVTRRWFEINASPLARTR